MGSRGIPVDAIDPSLLATEVSVLSGALPVWDSVDSPLTPVMFTLGAVRGGEGDTAAETIAFVEKFGRDIIPAFGT